MKKLMLFLMVGIFMVSLGSAAEFDNVLEYDESTNTITIVNAFGFGVDLIEVQLTQNLCEDGRFCEAQKVVTLYEEGALIQEFKTLRIDDDSWEEQNIRNYRFDYWTPQGWIQFQEGDIFPIGTYEIKTSGEIKPGRVYDWQIKIKGEWTTPWATWGNISLGDDAEVILNSPVDGLVSLINPITFNATTNITGGATLVNISLWTNETGSFEERINNNISGEFIFISTEVSSSSSSEMLKNITTNMLIPNITSQIKKTLIGGGGSDVQFWRWEYYYADGTVGTIQIDSATTSFVNQTFLNPQPLKIVTRAEFWGGTQGVHTVQERNSFIFRTDPNGVPITFNRTITGVTLWNIGACDTDGDCGFAPDNFTVSLDSTFPNITVQAPLGTLDYNFIGANETLNVTFNDINLETCWFDYNGTNITIDGCQSGILNSTNFTLELNNLNMTIYANDTIGNENSTFIEWDYKVLELNTIFNESLLVTDQGIYNLHFATSGSTVSTPNLLFNGVDNLATLTNNGDGSFNISATRTALSTDLINNSFNFEIDIDASTISTRTINQTINSIFMSSCLEGNVSSYIHLNFLDETTLSSLNASVSSSIWDFWLDDKTNSQQFLFNNVAENETYDFCFSPNDRTYTLDIEFPYLSTGYPQRVFRANNIILTNETTNKTLYLLSDDDGFFTRYVAINSLTGSAIEGVEVTVQKDISGVPTTIAQGITDDTGLLTLWLDPDDSHSFTFIKEGFQVSEFSIRPSSPDTYQIAMIPTGTTDVGNGTDIVVGLNYEILPSQLTLEPQINHVFSFNVSRVEGVDNFTMILSTNGTTIFSGSNVGNGIISTIINTSSNSSIFGEYTINLGNETLQLTKSWTIINITTGDFSLKAWINFGNELEFNSLWWGLFRYLFMMIVLLSIAYGFYYLDPFDSSSASLVAAIIVVWLFGTFGWLTINTPLNGTIDKIIIPSLFSLFMISFILWRYKSQ